MISSYSASTRHKFLYLLGQSRPTAGRAWWNMTSLTQGPNWPFRCLDIWYLQILLSADPVNMDAKSQMTELAIQRVVCSFITNWHLFGRRWGVYLLHFHTTRNSLWTNFERKPEILRIWIWGRAPWAKAAYFVLSSVLELVSEQCFVFFCSWLYKLHS